MIPAIGVMVGAYIITRMVRLLVDKEDTGIITTILAAATILISIYSIYVLVTSGIDISNINY